MKTPRGVIERSVLFAAWERLKRSYLLPGLDEGFSHYARRVISLVKRPTFSPEGRRPDKGHEDPSPREFGPPPRGSGCSQPA